MLNFRRFLAAGAAAAFFGSLQLGAVYGLVSVIHPDAILATMPLAERLVAGPVGAMMGFGTLGTFYAIVPCVVLSLLSGPFVRAQYRSVGVGRPIGYVVALALSLLAYGVAGAVAGKLVAFIGMFAASVVVYPVTGLLALNLMARRRYPPFTGIPAQPV